MRAVFFVKIFFKNVCKMAGEIRESCIFINITG